MPQQPPAHPRDLTWGYADHLWLPRFLASLNIRHTLRTSFPEMLLKTLYPSEDSTAPTACGHSIHSSGNIILRSKHTYLYF